MPTNKKTKCAPSLINRIEANIHERARLSAEFRELTRGETLDRIIADFSSKLILTEASSIPLLREKIAKAEARKKALSLIPKKLAKEAGL